MAVNTLIYNGAAYEDELTATVGRLNMSHAMVGETLSVDTLHMPVVTGDLPERFIAADQAEEDWIVTEDDRELCTKDERAAPVAVSNGPGLYYFEDSLVGKYFLNELRQIGEHEHAFTFYSAIKLLGQSKHVGGLYNGQLAGDVLAEIMGGVAYTVDSDIAAVQVYGYLPYAWRRNNLQKLLMAIGGAVRNAADGTLRITTLSDTVVGTFDESRIFIGGSVIDRVPATAVQVTEHNYIPSSDTTVLYENASIDTETIYFDQPYHDYAITNGTIVSSGVNYVTFTGAGLVTITGQKYIHITRIITAGNPPTDSADDVVKTVTDNTLINPFNAVEVAERVYGYLSVAQSVNAEVVFGNERPGDVVKLLHPYTKQHVQACIKSMAISMGYTELRAMTEFLVGYIPPSLISGFENYVVLTGSGQWTIPTGVTRIRAILVKPGSGGSGGENGQKGKQITSPGMGGLGGQGGEAGSGGTIFEINLVVTPLSTLSYICGPGGSGGTTGQAGSAGADTTLGPYSASMGREYPDGYLEPKTGLVFGRSGVDGVKGGDSRHYDTTTGSVVFDGVTYHAGENGTDVPGNYPGNSGTAVGGGGGGAAVGSNGQSGVAGKWEYRSVSGGLFGTFTGYWAIHGRGGNGADATIDGSDGETYGCGGSGGHGGGGGGYAVGDLPSLFDIPGDYYQLEALGGAGSQGGDGGDGCIVIYY